MTKTNFYIRRVNSQKPACNGECSFVAFQNTFHYQARRIFVFKDHFHKKYCKARKKGVKSRTLNAETCFS